MTMNNQDRHVQAYRVISRIHDAFKNNEALLITASATWDWGVNPLFSQG